MVQTGFETEELRDDYLPTGGRHTSTRWEPW